VNAIFKKKSITTDFGQNKMEFQSIGVAENA
jgi:hypothetical protein